MKKGVDKPRSKWYHKQAPKTRESNRHMRKRRVQKEHWKLNSIKEKGPVNCKRGQLTKQKKVSKSQESGRNLIEEMDILIESLILAQDERWRRA